jgi:hypothetical protein
LVLISGARNVFLKRFIRILRTNSVRFGLGGSNVCMIVRHVRIIVPQVLKVGFQFTKQFHLLSQLKYIKQGLYK